VNLPTLLRLEDDPRFKKLSYMDQQRLRAKATVSDLSDDPRFQKLPANARRQLVTKFIGSRKPGYQDPQFAKTANELTSRIENGDNKAMLIFLKNLQDRYGMKAGMLKAGSALISMKLADWAEKNNIRTALGKYATSDFLTGSDADKFYAYASKNLFSDNPKAREGLEKAIKTLRISSPVLAFGADLAAMWGGSVAVAGSKAVTGMVGKSAGALTAARSTGQIGPGAFKIGMWASRVGIPAFTDAMLGGTFGVARENLIALANKEPDRLTNTVKEIGRAFGEYAAWDLALGMAIPTAISFVGGAARRIGKHGDDLIRTPLNKVEREGMLQRFQTGDMSDAQFNMLTDIGQDLYLQNKTVRMLADKIDEYRIRPLEAAHRDAASNGMIFRQLDDGKFRLTKITETKGPKNKPVMHYKQEQYDTLLEAKTEMANHLARQRRLKMSAEQIADFDGDLANDSIRKLMITANNADEALDPIYKFDLDKADVKKMKKARTDSYRSPAERVAVTSSEATEFVDGKKAFRVGVARADDIAKQLKKTPKRPVNPSEPSVLPVRGKAPDDFVEGVVFANSPASDEIYQYADQWANTVRQKNPALEESRENLRGLFLLENGFDSHIKRAPDGSVAAVETFLPDRVRLISKEAMPAILEGKLDSVKAAKIVRAGNNVTGLQELPNGGIAGNETNLRKYWSKFTNKRWQKNFKEVLNTDSFAIWKSPNNTYKLTMPEAGVSREFSSLREAKRFARDNWFDAGKVLREADTRGLSARMVNDTFEITTPDGKTMTARNEDEVKAIFREYANADGANEIFEEFEPGFTNEYEDIILSYDRNIVPPGTMKTDLNAPTSMVYNDMNGGDIRLQTRHHVKRLVSQTDALVEDIGQSIDSPEFMATYRGMKRAVQIKNGQFHEMLEYVYNDIFTSVPAGDKRVNYWKPKYRDRRRIINYYRIKDTDPRASELYGKLTKQHGGITDEEIQIANKIDEIYQTLGKRFGVDPNKMVKEYAPRIRKFVEDPMNHQSILNKPIADKLMPDVFGGTSNNVPGEIKAWFHEARTSEFLTFFTEDDAMMGLIKYIDKGLSVEHISPAWDQMRETLTKLGNADLTDIMGRYAQKALNTFHTAGEDAMRKIGTTFFANMNKRFAQAGKTGGLAKLIPKEGGDMLSILYNLNYLTNMAWRPWLAVRNSFQIWTTLAPRVGNDVVGEAARRTHQQILDGDELIETLRKVGFLDRRPPIRGELGSVGTGLNRLNQKAFKMFKGSDDYTRLVAYNAGQVQMDRALEQLRKGTLDLNTRGGKSAFLELTGLRKTDRFLSEELFGKVKKAFDSPVPNEDLIQSAKMTWGKKLIDDTMFVYNQSQTPMMFDGVVGKAFGRYGTYSTGYRANIWRGLKYGTAADKAGFIGRFIMNQSALWATFGALGIKATNFIPGQPAIFTGGPMFDLAMNILNAAEPMGYKGKQARGELGRALTQLVPGSMQYRYLKQAIEYVDQGDWWKGFLAITTTPTLPGPFLSS